MGWQKRVDIINNAVRPHLGATQPPLRPDAMESARTGSRRSATWRDGRTQHSCAGTQGDRDPMGSRSRFKPWEPRALLRRPASLRRLGGDRPFNSRWRCPWSILRRAGGRQTRCLQSGAPGRAPRLQPTRSTGRRRASGRLPSSPAGARWSAMRSSTTRTGWASRSRAPTSRDVDLSDLRGRHPSRCLRDGRPRTRRSSRRRRTSTRHRWGLAVGVRVRRPEVFREQPALRRAWCVRRLRDLLKEKTERMSWVTRWSERCTSAP